MIIMAGLCIFMPQDELNQTFDLGDDYFSGYFSNSEITDIDSSYIGSVIDLDALTKISQTAECIYGKHDGAGKWICNRNLYDPDLSSVQDHH